MKAVDPVHTQDAQCQDCCRCIRECPVKAIVRSSGRARVEGTACVRCGHCVLTCPVGAKVIRSDLEAVRDLLAAGRQPWISLAPSWPAEFPDWTPGRWAAAARDLGFAGVSETALGAQAVVAALGPLLGAQPGLHLSSACPSVVSYVRRYRPDLCGLLTPVPSPLGAHAEGLQKLYGAQVPVVFVGPCAAKKVEADEAPQRIAAALTFSEWEALAGGLAPRDEGTFEPSTAGPGAAFALEGGVAAAVARMHPGAGWRTAGVSGFEAVRRALDEAPDRHRQLQGEGRSVYLELLACEGGCTGGPGTTRAALNPLSGRWRVEDRLTDRAAVWPPARTDASWSPQPVVHPEAPAARVEAVLHHLGKAQTKERLNCSGCGYETCEAFAEAVVRGRAEDDMCVSYNRRWAQKKLSALVRTMPFALVIADDALKILEANGPFIDLAGPEAQTYQDILPGLEGLNLADFVPFADPFRSVLTTGRPQGPRTFTWGPRQLEGWLFPIDEGRAVGGLFRDVTEDRRVQGQVVDQTRTVLRKNVEIVQKIAFLLGENAADTEAILNSILHTFGDRT